MKTDGYIKDYAAPVDNKKIGLPFIVFCNMLLVTHDDEHIRRFQQKIKDIDKISGAYNQFVFEKTESTRHYKKT